MISSSEFENFINEQLSGYLVAFNLADTKRRNQYLGFPAVDNDLHYFDELLKSAIATTGKTRRVSADVWFWFLKEHPAHLIQQAFTQYTETTEVKLKFTAEATTPDGETKVIHNEANSTIVRTFRCLFDYLQEGCDLHHSFNQLLEHIHKNQIGTVQSLADVIALDSSQVRLWKCVADLGLAQYVCPICSSRDFNWIDGTDDTSYGICTTCGSECDFRFY